MIPAYDLSSRNTFRMKALCAMYVEIECEDALRTLEWSCLPRPVMVLGGGSNLLFTRDFPGTVLHVGISHCHSERSEESVLVRCGAGVVFDDFCAWASKEDLWGPENLSLIPGECGASAVQNIGAYGVEVKDILACIRAYDRSTGTFVNIDPATCGYGYRTSNFKTIWKGRYIITEVTYRLSIKPNPRLEYKGLREALGVGTPSETHGHPRPCKREGPAGKAGGKGPSEAREVSEGVPTPRAVRDAIIEIRRSKLPEPAEMGSAGSFFCNPVVPVEVFERIEGNPPHYAQGDGVKVPAAWLIDQCGFKGASYGGAKVWEKQPLVIVNASGTASADDILTLENQIITAVKEKFGITLKPEVEHV